LQTCLAVAFGETVFGKQVVQGKAVYLALEDNHRRLQSRLKQLRPQGYSTSNLLLHTKWERFDKGGVEALVKLIETETPKIVVIDTLAKGKTDCR
jgi:RecA-family ATPase